MSWTTPRTWTPGEVVTAAMLNTHLRDNLNAVGEHRYVRKSTDETVNNTAALQSDDELVFAMLASETWLFEIVLTLGNGNSTADFKVALNSPTGSLGTWSAWGQVNGLVQAVSPTASEGQFADGGTAAFEFNSPVLIKGQIVNGGTPGDLVLRWAQNAATAVNTTVREGGFLIAHRI